VATLRRSNNRSSTRGLRTRVQKTVLPNGLTIVSESQPGFQSLALGVWVRAGTRHETSGEAGVSHFLEHMLFKGTRTRSALEIARQVDEVGGEFNAFTAREHTCFHLLLLAKDLSLGADLLADVLLESEFDPEEFAREKKVILQEIAMIDESPEEWVHDLHMERIFPGQGLGKPILGTIGSIRSMSRETLLDYFHRHYRASELVVAVAGDVSHADVLRAFRKLGRKSYPGRVQRTSEARAWGAEKKPEFVPGRHWVRRPTEQVHLVWGVPAPDALSPARFAAFLLNTHLGGSMSSALFQKIRETHALAYTVYSSFSPYLGAGLLSVYAATRPSQVALCCRLIEEECERLGRRALGVRELARIKDNLKGTLLLASDSVESRMMTLGRNELFFGREVPLDSLMQAIDQVTPSEFRQLAATLFQEDRRALTLVGPRPDAAVLRKLGL
jgi:predicted Zn-dependent peptidase